MNALSIVSSARLHTIEPEVYLRCLIRLAPLWPAARILELTPLFRAQTRARLDPDELLKDAGPIAIPKEPLNTSRSPEKPASSC